MISDRELAPLGPAAASPDEQEAATRHVMWRVDQGLLDADGALEVLEALGLVEGESGGRYDPVGRRIRPRSRKR